jgi:hypothetical protein
MEDKTYWFISYVWRRTGMSGWDFQNTVQNLDPFIWLETALEYRGEQYRLIGFWQISEEVFNKLDGRIG